MRRLLVWALLLAAIPCQVHASMVNINFAGPGVSGNVQLTYGTATDAKYPQAFEVTAISGTFTDTNSGLNIVDASIISLVPITHDAPESTNLLAPNDFSKFQVASGLPAENHGSLSFDNLFWPGGSVPTASDYPVHGGFLDIYGLLFNIGSGRVVNFWSNGDYSGTGHIDYGVAVATSAQALDYVGGGVSAAVVPEPNTLVLLGPGLASIVVMWRRDRRKGRIQN